MRSEQTSHCSCALDWLESAALKHGAEPGPPMLNISAVKIDEASGRMLEHHTVATTLSRVGPGICGVNIILPDMRRVFQVFLQESRI